MNSSKRPVDVATDEADPWLQPDDWLSPLAPDGDRATEYALRVTQGKVVAGPDVRNACKRHMHDLQHGAKRGLTYSHHAAGYAFRFFENILRLSEGQFEGTPFKLHESQAFIVGSLFGWLRLDGTRRFRRAYVEQGKGNGKSPLAGGVGLYGLVADKEAGAQIYAAAAKREQAGILFADAVKMVKQSPKLSGKLKFSGGEGREFNIAHHPSQSFFRPVSRDTGKTGSGPRPYFVLADEVHELPDRAILEMLERGFKFRRAPLLFMITNSGSNRNSVAWEEHEHAVKCAAGSIDAVTDHTFVGDVIDDTTFAYVCSLDDGDEPLKDPSCWIKANPLLGITIQMDYLHEAVAQARAIPGKLNGILRLHFCQWTEAETAWMTRETLDPCLADFDPWVLHKGKPCWIGLDLSQSRDITAMACLVRTGETKTGPTFDLWVEAWTPKDTMEARELRDKMPYAVWVQQKHLHAPPGENINYLHVAQTVIEYAQHFDVQLVAYDRFAFKAFEQAMTGDDGMAVTLPFAEHPQGGMKKGKPLEGSEAVNEETGAKEKAEGLWMPGSVRLFEDALLEKRIRIKRNPVMVSAMLSAVIEEDKWGNHWLAKTRSTNKIDCAVAGAMAVGASEKTAVREPDYGIYFI